MCRGLAEYSSILCYFRDTIPGALAKDVKKVISTGKQFAVLKPFDELMETFVRDNEIPGASLAVAKDGRLVYARGFGYADVEQQQQLT